VKDLTAAQIIALIESPHDHSIMPVLRRRAPVRQVLIALQTSTTPHLRQVLCDLLGYLHARSGVPLLVNMLDDRNFRVRCSAAESLGKIRAPQAGNAIFRHYLLRTELPERRTLAVALGAVGYQPAIPALIAALQHDDLSLRGCAAWSLGELRAVEAAPTLMHALSIETENYPRQRMKEAIDRIAAL